MNILEGFKLGKLKIPIRIPPVPPVSSWGGTISNGLDPKKNGVADAFDPKKNGVADAFDPKKNGVADAFDPKKNGVADAFDPKKNGVADAFDPKKNGVGDFFKGVGSIIAAPFIPPPPPPPPPPPWFPDSPPPPIPQPPPPVGLTPDQQSTFTSYLNTYIKNLTDNINKEFNATNEILSDLVNTNLAEITDLTAKVESQNKQIDQQTRDNYNITNKVTDIKAKYGTAEIDRIKSHNYLLFIIYYIAVVIFAIVLFFIKPDNFYINIAIVILMIFYPFLISQIESIIFIILQWIYSFIIGNTITSNIYLYH
jgi:hypothetical protein